MHFFGRALEHTPACAPPADVGRLLVNSGPSRTTDLDHTLGIRLGRGTQIGAMAIVTASTEAGAVSKRGQLDFYTPLSITVPLVANSVNHPIVAARLAITRGGARQRATHHTIHHEIAVPLIGDEDLVV